VRCPWLLAERKVATILGILVQAECVRSPWLLTVTKVATILGIGLSGVRAMPLAAGINKGGHCFRYWSENGACYFSPPRSYQRVLKF
jgi:hypothetical protein